MSPAVLRGRAEVARRRKQLDAAFSRAGTIDTADLQLRADFAKYLCILVAGHVEKSVQELAQEWCRQKSAESVARYAATRLGKVRNINATKLCELVGSFEASWEADLRNGFADELVALDGLINLRNQVAHGVSVGTSMADAQRYLRDISVVLDHLNDLFDPV